MLSLRTNDVEGWHHGLHRRASGRANLPQANSPTKKMTRPHNYSSPVEALNLIVDSKSQPVELNNSTIGVICAVEAIAWVTSVSVEQREENGVFGVLPARITRREKK